MYDGSMGNSKENILENLKKRIDFVSSLKPRSRIQNIKIRHTLDIDINVVKSKNRREIDKNWFHIREEVESTSSADLYNTDESKKYKSDKKQPWSYREGKEKYSGKHLIMDHFTKCTFLCYTYS